MLVALVVLPFFVNYLVRTYAWIAMLGDEGLVNGVPTRLRDGIRFLNTPYAVIGGLVYGYLAFMLLPIYAALDRMDPSLIEAGKDLYGVALADVPARHASRTPSRACSPAPCSCSCRRSGDFVSAQLLGGPDEYMVGNLIQQQFFGAENWPFGAALTLGDDGLPAGLDDPLPALRGRGARRRERGAAPLPAAPAAPPAGEGLRPPALPARVHGALLRVPVRADRAGGPVLVQLHPVAPELRRASASAGTSASSSPSRCASR